jgi:hypothetical protein
MRSKFGQPVLCIFKQSFGLSFDFWIVWFLLCSKNKGNAYLSKKIKIIKIILLYSSKFNMCTFLIETLHFLFVIIVLPFIFADDAIICLANYGRLCTSESEHLYFSLWIHVLLALVLLYVPRDDFIMFLALLKVEPMYFLSKLCVLPIAIVCTSQSSTPVLIAIIGYTSRSLCVYSLEQKFCTSQKSNMYFM